MIQLHVPTGAEWEAFLASGASSLRLRQAGGLFLELRALLKTSSAQALHAAWRDIADKLETYSANIHDPEAQPLDQNELMTPAHFQEAIASVSLPADKDHHPAAVLSLSCAIGALYKLRVAVERQKHAPATGKEARAIAEDVVDAARLCQLAEHWRSIEYWQNRHEAVEQPLLATKKAHADAAKKKHAGSYEERALCIKLYADRKAEAKKLGKKLTRDAAAEALTNVGADGKKLVKAAFTTVRKWIREYEKQQGKTSSDQK